MAIGLTGKAVALTIGGQAGIAGTVTKDFSIAAAPLDVTDDQSSGYRELLATGGVKTLDLSLSGSVKDYGLALTILGSSQEVACVVDLGDGTTTSSELTFNAVITEYGFSGDSNEVLTFTASLQSTGTIGITAGS